MKHVNLGSRNGFRRRVELALLAALLPTMMLMGQSSASVLQGFARIPGGTFMMGSADDEVNRDGDEGPQHRVTVPLFALKITEVTRGEFARFVDATGFLTDAELSLTGCAPQPDGGAENSWRDPGWDQTDDHPVVCVSRNDAMRYAAWLSVQTGASLRLPT